MSELPLGWVWWVSEAALSQISRLASRLGPPGMTNLPAIGSESRDTGRIPKLTTFKLLCLAS